MAWIKKGLVFSPQQNTVSNSHLQVPTVLVKDDRLRVFYAGRDSQGKSYTAYIDLDINDFHKIIGVNEQPILAPGNPGTFDDEGIMPSEVVWEKGLLYLYYSGWNQRKTIPYHNATGIAVSQDGGATFKRMYEGPIMDRIATEPYLAVTPCILREKDLWRMWYISGLKWTEIDGHFEPVYAIKYASSNDGLKWDREGEICIPQKHELEAFSRPSVIKKNGTYCMWFCCRDSFDYRNGAGSYRMGYAESLDGLNWQRKDQESGIDISNNEDDWDSKMLCYPYIVEVNGKNYLFYNGNGFGQSGFGYAEWVN